LAGAGVGDTIGLIIIMAPHSLIMAVLPMLKRKHYKEGTLIIDLIDTHTRKIVWRGFGVGEVHHDPQKDIDDLPKVVNGILDQLQLTPSPARVS